MTLDKNPFSSWNVEILSGKDLHLRGQVVINSAECHNQSFNKVYESSASIFARFRSTFGTQKEWKWSVTFSLLAQLRCNQNDMLDFVVFEKFTSDDLSQIAGEKSFDYLLIIYIHAKIWVFSTAATERNTTAIKIPLMCFVYLGFGWGKRCIRGLIDFCSRGSYRLLQQRNGEN